MPQQAFTDAQREAAYKAVEAAPELRAAVANTAVVQMQTSEELPAVTLPVEDIVAVLVQGLVGVPTVVGGQVVAEIIPRPPATLGGVLERRTALSRLFEGIDWIAMSDAVHIAWEQHCPKGLAFPSDTQPPGTPVERFRSEGWDV